MKPSEDALINELQSRVMEFMLGFNLRIGGTVIEPKEVEVYYYKDGEFEDNSVHRNELQAMNPNRFYVHRMGVSRQDKYKGRNYAGVDWVVSNQSGVYYSYLIRSAVVDNSLVVGPNKVLNAILEASKLTKEELENRQVGRLACDRRYDVLFSQRINLGVKVNDKFRSCKLRAVVCDEFFRTAKYSAKEEMIYNYVYDKFNSQEMTKAEALGYVKEKLGYVPSLIRML
ncbi:MAG: hypothetical protein J6V54_08640 [Bacteroidales bacterium]|nr:hypothetical protein [Bacteroidales bacterium]